jgi:hypothetical protein
MKKIIIEVEQPNTVTRKYGINKLMIENEQPHKVIRSKDKIIVRQNDTKTQTLTLVKSDNLTVRQRNTKSNSLIIH